MWSNVSSLPSPRVAKLAVENSGNHDSIGTFSVNISTWMLILCGQKVGLVHHLIRSVWISGYRNANHALIMRFMKRIIQICLGSKYWAVENVYDANWIAMDHVVSFFH